MRRGLLTVTVSSEAPATCGDESIPTLAGRITRTMRIRAWLGCGGGSERSAGWTVCLGARIRHSGKGLGSGRRMRLGLSSQDVDPTLWCGGRPGRNRDRGEGASFSGGKSISEGGGAGRGHPGAAGLMSAFLLHLLPTITFSGTWPPSFFSNPPGSRPLAVGLPPGTPRIPPTPLSSLLKCHLS